MDPAPSANAMAGNEIEDELVLMQPRSVRVSQVPNPKCFVYKLHASDNSGQMRGVID